MEKAAMICVWFITILALEAFGSATAIDLLSINDSLSVDRNLAETINIALSNNDRGNFTLVLPRNAYDVLRGSEPVNGSVVEIPTVCTRCNFSVSYRLNDVVTEELNSSLGFSRTLNYELKPARFRYSVTLPEGYSVNKGGDQADPSIVPQQSSLTTDGSHFTIVWNSTNQVFPMRYYVKYSQAPEQEEFQEQVFPFLAGLCAALLITTVFFAAKYRQELRKGHGLYSAGMAGSEAQTDESGGDAMSGPLLQPVMVPGSLLTPDEKKVLGVIRENNNDIRQREVVRILNWSKSKVSAIVSNLEYKKILKREKIGRNYRIELVRDYIEGI